MGKKIIILVSLLILLIIYTVVTFNYKTILDKDNTLQSTNSSLDSNTFLDTFNSIKNDILNLLSSKKDGQTQNNELPSNDKKEVLEDDVKKTEEKKNIANIDTNNEEEKIVQNEIQNIQTKEKIIENEKVVNTKNKISTKDILQTNINSILSSEKITFKRGSTKLTQNSKKVMQEIAKLLKENKKFYIEIAGHTDSKGKASLNKRISQKRANRVKNHLIKLGISKSRLKAVGYGEDFPIAKDDENGLSEINRRVEINVTGEIK